MDGGPIQTICGTFAAYALTQTRIRQLVERPVQRPRDPSSIAPTDDVERAVVLLHESYHIFGFGEKTAYTETWLNKEKLGWTKEKYGSTGFWNSVELGTKQYAPELFR